jgi:probable HAF family extracellular repeat protein
LYPFAGDFASLAIGINDRGQVAGASLDANFVPRAMLWPDGAENNGMGIDLNTLVPEDSPLYLLGAFSINANGEIAGFGVTNDGDLHGFLATPNNGEDNQQMRLSTKGRAITVALSENARRLLFQRFGIRKR